jgi:CheY-like chemotaxis protein
MFLAAGCLREKSKQLGRIAIHEQDGGVAVVLVVEDDRDIAECIEGVLQDSGHEARVAGNGREALKCLDEMSRPCLLLVDLMMPVMDGPTLVQEIARRDDHDQLPVVVMSSQPNLSRALAWPGVRGVLKKPFDVNDVIGAVEQYCSAG